MSPEEYLYYHYLYERDAAVTQFVSARVFNINRQLNMVTRNIATPTDSQLHADWSAAETH